MALFPSPCFPFLINPQESGLFSYSALLEHLPRVYRAVLNLVIHTFCVNMSNQHSTCVWAF